MQSLTMPLGKDVLCHIEAGGASHHNRRNLAAVYGLSGAEVEATWHAKHAQRSTDGVQSQPYRGSEYGWRDMGLIDAVQY